MNCRRRADLPPKINPSTVTRLRRGNTCIVVGGELFREISIRIVNRHRSIHRIDDCRAFIRWPAGIPPRKRPS